MNFGHLYTNNPIATLPYPNPNPDPVAPCSSEIARLRVRGEKTIPAAWIMVWVRVTVKVKVKVRVTVTVTGTVTVR